MARRKPAWTLALASIQTLIWKSDLPSWRASRSPSIMSSLYLLASPLWWMMVFSLKCLIKGLSLKNFRWLPWDHIRVAGISSGLIRTRVWTEGPLMLDKHSILELYPQAKDLLTPNHTDDSHSLVPGFCFSTTLSMHDMTITPSRS